MGQVEVTDYKKNWSPSAQRLVAVVSLGIIVLFTVMSLVIAKAIGNVNEPSDVQQHANFVAQMHKEATQQDAEDLNVIYVNLDTNTYVYEVSDKPFFRDSQGARKVSDIPLLWEVKNNHQFYLMAAKQFDRRWRFVMRFGDRKYSLTEVVQEFEFLLNR
ncbi:MAG: hypothetical protein KF884_03475 [Fimbriimonadaceae bacterium]|nr:hypothetical protein [Fimbriimonadaceae bacterium]QYK59152.1 MAG: hypothetical protein KF884_03475 [Fimbriimonadaceae bacterium]